MKLIVIAAVLVAIVAASRPKWNELEGYTFDQYVKDFGKSHVVGTTEYARREKIFNAKLAQVIAFNAERGQLYKKGINHMSDWTAEEFKRLNGRVPDSQMPKTQAEKVLEKSNVKLPVSVDYRHTFPPVLSAVKDQGQCGSCWAHAATESVETHWAIKTGQLYALSQQQITSCVPNTQHCGGTGGCSGATAELAFDYLVSVGGLAQEWTYSYTSYFGDSGTCNVTANTPPVVTISGYTSIQRNDDGAVAEALANHGPLAISVDASSWSDYDSGIFTGCNYANNISMDHAVQLVGYGFDDDLQQAYWLVRNSWSPGWGETGFIRLLRETTATCGWNIDWITNGGGCPNGPNTVWACGMCGILYDTLFPNPSV